MAEPAVLGLCACPLDVRGVLHPGIDDEGGMILLEFGLPTRPAVPKRLGPDLHPNSAVDRAETRPKVLVSVTLEPRHYAGRPLLDYREAFIQLGSQLGEDRYLPARPAVALPLGARRVSRELATPPRGEATRKKIA